MTNPANSPQPSGTDNASAAPIPAAWLGGATTPAHFAIVEEVRALDVDLTSLRKAVESAHDRIRELTTAIASPIGFLAKSEICRQLAEVFESLDIMAKRHAKAMARLAELRPLKGGSNAV